MQRIVERMLKAHPEPPIAAAEPLTECIKACVECAEACTSCADAGVAEHTAMLEHCIRLCLDTADICAMTAKVLSRQSEPDLVLVGQAVELCALACHACGKECLRHSPWHAHCQICAACCQHCADACRALMAGAAAISGVSH